MKWFGLLAAIALTTQILPASDSDGASATVQLPPVLKKAEPADSVVVTLPGTPMAPATHAPHTPLPATDVHLAPPAEDPERPILHRARRDFPPEFEEDSAEFLNSQIGAWQQIDALELLGDPTSRRPAYDDDQTVNGQILAFPDPTGRYKEVELDFDQDSGLLRTLFVYPHSMSWTDCRRAFGTNVRATQANKGRTFYSYLDRRLDVLVDSAGKVISLGMY